MTRHIHRYLAPVGVLALAVSLVACSGGDAPDSTASAEGGALPESIELQAIQDLSGTSGPGGQTTQQGMQVAVDEINDTDFLEGTTLSITWTDSATDPTKGANAMTKIAASDTPLAFGSFTSGTALAEAPIAQRAGLPTIFTQAGADGVLEPGEYIYRATPMQTSYFNLTQEYLQDQGVKTAAVIYDTDVPTIVDLADMFQESAGDYGYEVTDVEATTSQTVDVSSQITKMLGTNPDAIFVDVLLAHNVQVIKQLRQAGYDGIIVAQQGAGGGVLEPLGADADGIVLANDFNALNTAEKSKNFTDLYTEAFGKAPGNFAAEGYDAVWIAAHALKNAGSVDRADVLKGLQEVADAGLEGALGEITFEDRQEITPGVLVQIVDGVETPVE